MIWIGLKWTSIYLDFERANCVNKLVHTMIYNVIFHLDMYFFSEHTIIQAEILQK